MKRKEEKKNRRKPFDIFASSMSIIPAAAIALGIAMTFYMVTTAVNDFFDASGPVIKANTNDWTKEALVSVEKDAVIIDGVDHYLYCVTSKDTKKGCHWIKTTTKNARITKSGKWNVWFIGVNAMERKAKYRIKKECL